MTSIDYSSLRLANSFGTNWRDIFETDFPASIQKWIKEVIYLPHDHYPIIASYLLLPSALCRITPYLFFYGVSGSGKSTIGKLAASLYGIDINSSSDTFAAIRNSLNSRKFRHIEVPAPVGSIMPFSYVETEVHMMMVWDDVDPGSFKTNPDIFKLFKYGYDRASDKIMISSKDAGENLEFHCFCPKIFSSITPFHTLEDFKELRRRMLVIPTARIEDLSDDRKASLGITGGMGKHFSPDEVDWEGCSESFGKYWDLQRCEEWLAVRRTIRAKLTKLTSNQKIICLDLATTGIVTGIWGDEKEANNYLAAYFCWLENESETGKDSLFAVIERIIFTERQNCLAASIPLKIVNKTFRAQLDNYYAQGWLTEKPTGRTVSNAMTNLGYYLTTGVWEKR